MTGFSPVALAALLAAGVFQADVPASPPSPAETANLAAAAASALAEERWATAADLSRGCAVGYRAAGDDRGEVLCRLGEARAELQRGNHEPALGALQQVLSTLSGKPWGADLEGSCHLLFAESYRERKLYDDAAAHLERGLALSRSIRDRFSEAAFLERLGFIETLRDRWREAEQYLRAASTLAEEVSAEDVSALSLRHLAHLKRSQGRFREASELLEKAAELARRRSSQGDEASSLELLGSVYIDLHKYDEALQALSKAETLLAYEEKTPARLWVVRKEIGEAFAALGRLPQALALDEQVIAHYRSANDEARLPAVLMAAARILARQGRSREQQAYLEEALRLRQRAKDRAGEAEVLNELGHFEFQRNSYEEGLRRFEEALARFRSVHSKTGEMEALFNTAHLYFDLGRPEEARIRYEQALRLARDLDSYLVEASILRDMARLSIYESRWDEALVRIEEALMLARQTGSPFDEIDALKLKGDVLGRCRCGRDHEALTAFSEALALSKQSSDPNAKLNVLFSIGRLQLSNGDPAAAARTFEEVLAERRGAHSELQESEVLTLLANAYQDLGQNDRSIGLYRQALAGEDAILDRMGTDEFLLHQERQAVDAASPLIQLLVASGRAEEAYAVAEDARSRAFLRQIRDHPLDLYRGADSELLAEEERLRGALRAIDRDMRSEQRKPFDEQDRALLETLSREVDEARQRYETLLIRLQQTHPEYGSLKRPTPLSLSAVQRLLEREATLVEYFVLLDQTIVWVIDRESYHLVRLPLTAQQLYEKVALWRAGVMAHAANAELEFALYRDLVAPLESSLSHRSLLIVSHESLQWLSFAALRDSSGNPLIERFSLSYLPNASALPFLAARRSPRSGRLLAMGDPDGSLPHAAAEARAVAALYGTRALLGHEATETVLRKRSHGADLIHIATHSILDSARPLFSRLELAPSAEDDGSFELHEVFGLDLAGTGLVVLSGCDTGRGSLKPGEELVGWSRAFLHAGASSVLATLWPIDDAASEALMTSFHRHFRQGLSSVESLRAAQREIAKEEHWKSSYFWASFTLMGDSDESGPAEAPVRAPVAMPGPDSFPAGKPQDRIPSAPLTAHNEGSPRLPVSLEISAAQAIARRHWEEAVRLCRQCADGYLVTGDRQGESFCLLGLALAEHKSGEARASTDALLEGLVASADHPRNSNIPIPHHILMAEVYLALPVHFEEATAHLEEALRLARSQNERLAEAFVLGRLGAMALKRGKLDQAAEPLEAGLAIARRERLDDLLGGLLYDLALLDSKQGRVERSAELLREASALAHRRGEPGEEAASLQALGSALLALHQPGRALEALAKAESLLSKKDTDTLWTARKDMAQALACQGNLPEAMALYDSAIKHYRLVDEEWQSPPLLTAAAEALGRQGRPGEQQAYLLEALRIWRELGNKIGEADVLNQLGILEFSWSSLEQALESFEQAIESSRSVKGRRSEGEALLNSARVYLSLGRNEEARSRYQQALKLAQELSNSTLEASVRGDLARLPTD